MVRCNGVSTWLRDPKKWDNLLLLLPLLVVLLFLLFFYTRDWFEKRTTTAVSKQASRRAHKEINRRFRWVSVRSLLFQVKKRPSTAMGWSRVSTVNPQEIVYIAAKWWTGERSAAQWVGRSCLLDRTTTTTFTSRVLILEESQIESDDVTVYSGHQRTSKR